MTNQWNISGGIGANGDSEDAFKAFLEEVSTMASGSTDTILTESADSGAPVKSVVLQEWAALIAPAS